MRFFRNRHAVVLLFVLMQELVLASIDDENNTMETFSTAMISSKQVPWIDKMNSAKRSSENSCAEEVTATLEAFNASQTWAREMLDASSKIQSGIMKGNLKDLGMYDQCIETNGEYNGLNVQGKYCTVTFGTLSSAVCVPSACNETDVVELVNPIIKNLTEIINLELEINSVSCVRLEAEDFTMGEILTIIFFSTVVGFIVFCTICEFVKIYRTADVSPIVNNLAKFSLYNNAMALLSTEISPRMMPAIQGIRFISTCWVALGHRYFNTLYMPLVNSLEILEWYDSWSAVYVQTAPFAVDTFFVISGFLMCYMFLKSKQAGKRTNYPMMYIHRYIRLTPCIAILTLFVAVLLHRFANGPLGDTLRNSYVEPCRKNWWMSLLYVQNFVGVNEPCLLHSWYLAVDMQLFWISPFILYPLHRWPKFGLGILSLLLLGSVVAPAVILALNGTYSNAAFRLDTPRDKLLVNFRDFYIPTYNRACAYFVGLLLGYDAAKRKRQFTKLNVAINWAMACILILLCVLATHRVYNTSLGYDVVLETVLALLLRPFWSVAIAWIVYACTFGYGGAVTRILSLPIFLPLSRLSYSIYLVHMVIQIVKITSVQIPGRFSNFLVLDAFWGDLVLAIVVAFFFSLFFETPAIVLEKLLRNGGSRKPNPIQETKTDLEGGIDNKAMVQ